MKKASVYILNWRNKTREKMAEGFQNKCAVCGQEHDSSILQYHYFNPNKLQEKDFTINLFIRNPKRWSTIEESLRECFCVCPTCHKYIHKLTKRIPQTFIHYGEYSPREERIVKEFYESLP